MKKGATPGGFGGALAGILRSLGLTKKLRPYEVLDRWPAIVGERIAAVTTAERLEDGKLFIHVTRAPWRNELVFLKKDLMKKINETMGEEIVLDIIFR